MRYIFLFAFFFLLAAWLAAWLIFHVAGGLIHLLLLLAIISFVIHLIGGRRMA